MLGWMALLSVSMAANAGLALLLARSLRSRGELARELDGARTLRLAAEADRDASRDAAAEARRGAEALQAAARRSAEGEARLRARLAGLLDSSLVGVFFWDSGASAPDGRVRGMANATFRRMLGMPEPEGGSLACAPDFPLWTAVQWDELAATGTCAPFEIACRRPDGARVELLAAATSGPEGGQYLAIDITRLGEARRELQRSQVLYRAIAEHSPVGIWQIRPDRSTLYVNPAMLGFLELDGPDELMASPEAYYECFTADSLAVLDREIERRTRGISSSYEVEVLGRWGRFTRMMVYGAPIFGADGQLESLMGIFVDVTERRREEEALRQSEERLRVAARFSNDLIYEWDLASGRLEWFGPVAERLGLAEGAAPGTLEAWERLIHPEDARRVKAGIERHLAGRGTFAEEYRILSGDGAWRTWSDKGTALFDASGRPCKWIGACIDVTEARRAEESLRAKEEQLRQSQKLEAVGRLAGGIAHDFNNLLAAIMGYCELMLIRLDADHPCRREVGEILGSSDRAAGLIRQLLAFSRQEIPQPKVINPNLVISSMERMLRHLLEETIGLEIRLDARAGRVRIDPVQMEQVIMNLVVNARDAMPEGGALVVSTGNVDIDGDLPGAYGRVKPGPYVRVSVADSGQGIDKAHLPHIFDPFYTTKDKGKGSGLGLSTVYGIVTQNKGCVLVETEPTKGSVFSLYLPQTSEEPEVETEVRKALRSSAIVPRTVLVVEDDDEVRKIVRELLSQQGFLVLEARQGAEAISLVERYDQPLHLLLTDVVMPGIGGKDLASALQKSVPGLRVLFMSGYTQDASFREELSGGNRAFIQKPFTLTALLGKIREVMA